MKFIDKVLDHFTETTVEEIIEDNEERDYMLAIDYLVRTFPEKINSAAEAEGVRPTAIASNILEYINEMDYKLKYKDIIKEEKYDLIKKYVIKYFIRQKSVIEQKENSLKNKVGKALKEFGNKKVTLFNLPNGHKIKWQINKAVRSITLTVLIAGLGAVSINQVINIANENEDKKVSQYLAVLANPESEEPLKYGHSISAQNEVYNSRFDEYSYNISNIVQDIIDVTTKAPDLFDLCLYDVYYGMKDDRLYNMDRIFNLLKNTMANDDTFQDPKYANILAKIMYCNYFLDYLIDNDLIEISDDFMYSAEVYKRVGNIKKLSTRLQLIISKTMESYKKNNRKEFHETYRKHISEENKEEEKMGR